MPYYLEREIRRHTDLYEPYLLYAKALKLWGDYVQGARPKESDSALLPLLDSHQYEGFRRALQIADRFEGVMICDGVGLGKSFIALALMEHYCRGDARGKQDNVLLIAPRNILRTTWDGYLKRYLRRYTSPFGSIHALAMTELGFEPEDEGTPPTDKHEMVRQLFERANVVVVDESHNFRTPSANRYKNLLRIVDWFDGRRKKVILLTATPVNTQYQDLAAQLALVTHEHGSLGGYTIRQIRQSARNLDRNQDVSAADDGQLSLELFQTPSGTLNQVLEHVVIQRSRQTCRRLAEAAGRELRFPVRRPPRCLEISLPDRDGSYRDLISLADRRFRPGVHLIELMRKEIERVEKAEATRQETQVQSVLDKLQRGARGLKLAAFLTEQYRRPGSVGVVRTYRFEVHLAKLVFANALKQLESSPPAFQGIIQSLATGLIARLSLIFGEMGIPEVQEHLDWVRTPLFPRAAAEPRLEPTDGDAEAEAAGPTTEEEVDEWLDQVIRSRGIARKLAAFDDANFDLARWRRDIIDDLGFLREIHCATLDARNHPDPKLEQIAGVAAEATRDGARLLIFTQSRRTAEYLEIELSQRLAGKNVARIDSTVAEKRASILHAFCPGYNERPEKWAPTVPDQIDVLISTDVLAEGVNLQETGAILNYDIHWNPVRLIQRIGRVDRRLDPRKTPNTHAFDIYNVLPPPEIERIIGLVGTVEHRTLTISRTVGLDLTFFKPTDPAGNLREFNSDAEKWDALYEGEVTLFDRALEAYVALASGDRRTLDRIADVPDGALAVWTNAPRAGLFACYVMTAREESTEEDRRHYKEILGQPVLGIRWHDGTVELDAPRVLAVLRNTVPGEASGQPSPDESLREGLRALRAHVRQQFAEVGGHGLPITIAPRLKCMIELKETACP